MQFAANEVSKDENYADLVIHSFLDEAIGVLRLTARRDHFGV